MRLGSVLPLLLWTSQVLAAPSPEAEAKALELEALADDIESHIQPRQQESQVDTVAGNVFYARNVCQERMNFISNALNGLPLSGNAGASLGSHIYQYQYQWSQLRERLTVIANGLRSLAAAARAGENMNSIRW